MIDTIIMIILGIIMIVLAALAVNSTRLFHSAVWLMLFLFTLSATFIFLGASIVGAIELLVYVGATVTLIVFTLMLTGGKEIE
jgi:NADH-quinone oxidoreductase subunit J